MPFAFEYQGGIACVYKETNSLQDIFTSVIGGDLDNSLGRGAEKRSWMRRLRPREVEALAHSHTARNEKNLAMKLQLLKPNPRLSSPPRPPSFRLKMQAGKTEGNGSNSSPSWPSLVLLRHQQTVG